MTIRYLTSGESHGRFLTALLEGLPAGVPITEKEVNAQMARRQHLYGRGARQKHIEKDAIQFVSGVRFGQTLGSPITMTIQNNDWVNWEKIMSVEAEDFDKKYLQMRPRPGHADLAGALKYNRIDTRDILERASARETAARVAIGAVCQKFLSLFGINIYSWVTQVGPVKAKIPGGSPKSIGALAQKSPILCPDANAAKRMMKLIDVTRSQKDTLGGIYEVVADGLPVGLGSHIQWDKRLDGLLAQGMMSLQAHKGVEIGGGFELGRKKGSDVHDEIFFNAKKGFYRRSNNAGGLEGGMTNGSPLVVRAIIKPLASLGKPLSSIHLKTKKTIKAEIVRSDTAPVAPSAVIGETVVASVLTNVFLEKFGGDSFKETMSNFQRYQKHVSSF